jgi:uncharacterized protein (DUF488 family)
MSEQFDLFSIGHSNAPLERVLDLLKVERIQVVADVRTYPRSRYVPHFDALPLREALSAQSIRYVAMGHQLGGRPADDSFYDAEGHVRYDRLAASSLFITGLDRLLHGASRYRIAMLCSEEDPAGCHRHLLIGLVLGRKGVEVCHIRHDGRVDPDSALPAPPGLRETGLADLFESEYAGWRSLRSVSPRGAHARSSAR